MPSSPAPQRPAAAAHVRPAALAVLLLLLVWAGTACDDPAEPRVPTALSIVDGDGQTGTVGEALAQPLRVRVLDQDGAPLPDQPVAWSASAGTLQRDSTTTDTAGVARAVLTLGGAPGAHRVTASAGGAVQVVFEATAEAGPPAALSLSADSLSFAAVGDTATVTAAARDRFGNPLESAVTWSSSDTAVVAVDGGRVVSRGRGEATITAAAGAATAVARVVVDPVPVRLVLSFDVDTLTALEDTVRLEARVLDANGSPVEGAGATFTSSAPSIVSVTSDGLASAVSPGTARVTAAAVGPSGEPTGPETEATVVVEQRVAAVVLGPAPDTLRSFGATASLTAGALDANGFAIETASFDWVSLDPGIASVDAGTATAHGRGVARIVASAGGRADTVVVAVIPWGRVTIAMELNRWEIYDVVFPIMRRHGLTGNIEVATMYIGDPDRITLPQIREMHDAGWAVVPHSRTLPVLTDLTDAQLRDEVLGSQAWVRDQGFRGSSVFIVPYHRAGDRELALIRQHFAAARIHGYLNVQYMPDWPPERPHELVGLEGEDFLDSPAGLAEIRELWLQAIHEGRLLEIYFHRVKESQAGGFETFARELAEYGQYVRTFAELFEE